ncbi:MAG: Maf family protein [Atopobiaceae bacterium]|jgi:septum formation protein|nr:Maf family protein [Atopobiaceae bacterium]MCH4180099.1 Maf family protein [Atopobiaceae bacterium]MCH4213849.1 Maf family protein [Atopobiaceae bacterium]MCH4229951.1 Maf family protein [Atopobiaceae bacterium]MCH4275688.1 Maf family protein [Atopobiaceae bacterium]
MILASSSPRRIELLFEAGYDARVIPADIDETPRTGETPKQLVDRLACAKAHAVASQATPGELVIAADTTVELDGRSLGKPADGAEAQAMLRALSGRTHEVSTGVCLLRTADPARSADTRERDFVETTEVAFYDLDDDLIAGYVRTGEPADKAGAYGIQGAGRLLVRKIDGDYYNVVGLPIARLVREMDALGAETDAPER